MIKGNSNILQWLKDNNTMYWRIRTGQNGDIIFNNLSDNSLTLDDSLEDLSRKLELMEAGIYYIEAWENEGQKKDWRKTRISLEGNINGINKTVHNPVHSGEDIQEQIKKAIHQFQIEQENKHLKEENAELKTKYDNVLYKILERTEPYIGGILENLFPNTKPQNVKISGINTKNNDMNEEKLTKRAENAIEKWFSLDQDAVILLEKITLLAENNKPMYEQAKTFLLKSE